MTARSRGLLIGTVSLLTIGSFGLVCAADYDGWRTQPEPPRKPLSQRPPAPRSAPTPLERIAPKRPDAVGPNAAREDSSKVGPPTVIGRVLFRGAVPPATQVEVSRDINVCGPVVNIQPVSVDPGTQGLRDAVVHVDAESAVGGNDGSGEGPSDVAPVMNKNCSFYPRVGAVRTGSEIEISNNDPVMHNTNMTMGSRTVLNVAMVAGGDPIRKPFKKPGLHQVKCNVHKFMYAYRYVFDDALYATTNEAGQYRITGLPPGLRTITVWHETLGPLQKEVQIPARGTVVVDLEYP